jgi:hypothetical protein
VYCADLYRERRYQMLCGIQSFLLKMGMLMPEILLSTCVLCRPLQRAKILDAVWNTIFPPENGHFIAPNISRIIM